MGLVCNRRVQQHLAMRCFLQTCLRIHNRGPSAFVEFGTVHVAGLHSPLACVRLPFDLSIKAIHTLAAETWLSVGILDVLAWGRCAVSKWSCAFP